jgi:hypothetical protein
MPLTPHPVNELLGFARLPDGKRHRARRLSQHLATVAQVDFVGNFGAKPYQQIGFQRRLDAFQRAVTALGRWQAQRKYLPFGPTLSPREPFAKATQSARRHAVQSSQQKNPPSQMSVTAKLQCQTSTRRPSPQEGCGLFDNDARIGNQQSNVLSRQAFILGTLAYYQDAGQSGRAGLHVPPDGCGH